MLRDDDDKNIEEVLKLRKSECVKCKHRISYIENNIVKYEGHYVTPDGIYCINCYKSK